MYGSSGSLIRLHTSLSESEKAERQRIQAQLDRLLAPLSEGELELLEGRHLIAVRNNPQFMAVSDAISDALDEGDVPTTDPCWERSSFLGEQIMLPVVQKFVASLRPATREQRSIATRHGVTLPAHCSSVEAGYILRQAIAAESRRPRKG